MKLNWRRILSDPSFWVLLIVNVYLVYYYEQRPQIFTTLIWLYWSQSVLYGLFNSLDMITSRKIDVSGFKSDFAKTKSDRYIANASAFGFLLHYGFFHLVYFIFLFTLKRTGPFEWDFYKRFLLVFVVSQVISFIQHKVQNRKRPANISNMFIIPYLRVVPMHLCILLPAFLKISNLTVFLVLKVITDIIMSVVTNNYYKKNDTLATVTGMNVNSTISDQTPGF